MTTTTNHSNLPTLTPAQVEQQRDPEMVARIKRAILDYLSGRPGAEADRERGPRRPGAECESGTG